MGKREKLRERERAREKKKEKVYVCVRERIDIQSPSISSKEVLARGIPTLKPPWGLGEPYAALALPFPQRFVVGKVPARRGGAGSWPEGWVPA